MQLILSILHILTYGKQWRYLSLIALFALEFTLLCQPQWQVSIVERLPFFSDLTLAQIIRVLRQLYVLLNFALSQVGPVLFPSDTKSEETTRKDLHKVMPSLLRLEAAITASQSDMQQLSLSDLKPLLQMSVASSTKDPSTDLDRVTFELKNAMVDTLCEGKLKSSEESRQVWIDAVRRNTAASESDVRHLHHDECVHDHHKDEKPCIQKDAKQELEGEVEISDQQSSELKRHVKRESENESLVTGDSSMNKKDDRSVAASAPAAKAPESTSS